MTDDLFEDFDLQNSNSIDDKIEKTEGVTVAESVSVDVNEVSSKEMHPDIFNSFDEGDNSDEEIFSFRDEEKAPFAADSDYERKDVVVEVRTIDKIRRPNVQIDPEHFGDTLRRMREDACVSLADLSEELRIKESFLAALEREDYENLPPEVFIVAYIRKLGGIYHLTEEEIVALSSKVRERMEIDLPEDMAVIDYEHSTENDDKVRHIVIGFCVITAIIILLIGSGIYFFVTGKVSKRSISTDVDKVYRREHFSADTLLELQPQVKLEAPVLKITK